MDNWKVIIGTTGTATTNTSAFDGDVLNKSYRGYRASQVIMDEFLNEVVADVPYIELSSERIEDEGGERKC